MRFPSFALKLKDGVAPRLSYSSFAETSGYIVYLTAWFPAIVGSSASSIVFHSAPPGFLGPVFICAAHGQFPSPRSKSLLYLSSDIRFLPASAT